MQQHQQTNTNKNTRNQIEREMNTGLVVYFGEYSDSASEPKNRKRQLRPSIESKPSAEPEPSVEPLNIRQLNTEYILSIK